MQLYVCAARSSSSAARLQGVIDDPAVTLASLLEDGFVQDITGRAEEEGEGKNGGCENTGVYSYIARALPTF